MRDEALLSLRLEVVLPLKILVTANYYPEKVGGIEFVTHNLISRFRQQAHEVRWVASDVRNRRRSHRDGDCPIKAWNFTERHLGFPYPLPHPLSLWAVNEHIRWSDVVHIHDSLYLHNQFIFWQARRWKKPIVLTQHVGLVPYDEAYKKVLQRIAHRSLGKNLMERADRVVFVSDVVRAWYDSFVRFRNQPSIIPNGVDTEIFNSAQTNRTNNGRAPSLLFVGRFTQKKGLNLIHEVASSEPSWQWTLVGTREEIDPRSWGLDNVRVLPPLGQKELGPLYQAADLMVLPSVGEGFPLVLAESMACGTPVLIGPETARAVQNLDQHVLTCELTVEDLKAKLSAALSDRPKLAALGDSARKFAYSRLDWNSAAASYLSIFNELTR
jgi:glycosyltransferase involved in cell wall biosynthesis